MINLTTIQKKRALFLSKVFEISNGDRRYSLNMKKIGEELCFDRIETKKIVDYLIAEGFIKPVALGGSIAITHEGIKKYETISSLPKKELEADHSSNATIHDKGNMLKVFMCHSTEDKMPIREFYKKLCLKGVDAWLDEEKLLPGQDWQLEIEKAIQSSHIVLVFLSNNSITKAGFIHKEIKRALDVADKQPNGTIFIIPARLEICEVPEIFRYLQRVDLFEISGFEKLMKALEARANQLDLEIRNFSNKSQLSISIAAFDKNDIINLLKSIESTSNVITIDNKMSGKWEGQWKSTGGDNGKCHLELYKIENEILGRASLENSIFSLFGKYYFKGKIENSSVFINMLLFDNNELPINGTIIIENETISIKGNYNIPTYDKGHFVFNKKL